MEFDWRFDSVFENFGVLLYGMQFTLILVAYSLAIGTVGGLLLAMLRMRRSRIIDMAIVPLIDILRAIPPLVLLFWAFYVLPVISGASVAPLDSVAIALGALTAALLSEIIRAGILSVERGQWEASHGLGMTTSQTYRRVILPQAILRMLPPIASAVMSLIKNSALAAALGVTEMTWQAGVMVQYNFRPIETFTVVAGLYFIVTYPVSLLVTFLQRRFSPHSAMS